MNESSVSPGFSNSMDDDLGSNRKAEKINQETPQQLMKDFSSYTTLHGFHFLAQSRSAVRRVIWLLLMLVCIAVLAVQLRENYQKLKRYESVAITSLEHSEEVRFPAVTICNQNMLRRNAINGTEAQLYLDRLDTLKQQGHSILSTFSQVKSNAASFDIEKVVRKAGHNLSEMIKTCSWKTQKCGPENFTVSLSFYRGLCYTFNSGEPGHPILYVTSSGTSQSLSLLVDVQSDEYYGPFSYAATGLKVLIHEQGEWPDIEDRGDDVSPGQNTNIKITRRKVVYLEPPYTPFCGSRKLATTNQYFIKNCLLECYTKITLEACSCRYLSIPTAMAGNVSRSCTTEELNNCVLPTFAKRNPNKCDCPLECDRYVYSEQLSSAYFPSAHFWDTVLQLLNYSSNDTSIKSNLQSMIRKRFLVLTVFYKSLSTEVTRQKPSYDIHDFGSDMGGSMGLFLGCSLLTLFEFLDLLVIAILMYVGRRASNTFTS